MRAELDNQLEELKETFLSYVREGNLAGCLETTAAIRALFYRAIDEIEEECRLTVEELSKKF